MSDFEHILKRKLADFATPPPEGAWDDIAFSLAMREKLRDHAAPPPPMKRLLGLCDSRAFGLRSALFTPTSLAVGTTTPPSAGAKIPRPEAKIDFGRKIPTTSKRPIPLGRWVGYAAAACVLLAAGLLFMENGERRTGNATTALAVEKTENVEAAGSQTAAGGEVLVGLSTPPPEAAAGCQPQKDEAEERGTQTEDRRPDAPAAAQRKPEAVSEFRPPIPDLRRKSRGLKGLGLYAANLPAGTASHNGMVSGVAMRSRAEAAGSLAAQGMPASHRLPISLGAEVTLDIAPNVSLQTGLVYSLLRSDFGEQGAAGYRTRQELHYLGVPLSVSYAFYRAPLVDFYVRGGGMIEKGLYGEVREGGRRKRQKLSGFQPSISASVGADVALGRALSLYLEPGIAYYPPTASQPASYRTEHPLSFALRAGVRLDIGR